MDADLLQKIAQLGEEPFLSEVVKTPWQQVVDAKSLNQSTKGKILKMVEESCRPDKESCQPDKPRCLVIMAAPGYGKSHLVAWTREQLGKRSGVCFVYVTPYRLENGPFERHLLLCIFNSLLRSSAMEQQYVEKKVLEILVKEYDALVKTRADRNILGVKRSWLAFFTGRIPVIQEKPLDSQKEQIKVVLNRPGFLKKAFARLSRAWPSSNNEGTDDMDTFQALCSFIFGDQEQNSLASKWFRSEHLSTEEQKNLGVSTIAWNLGKVKNCIWTLNRLLGQSFCITFDQMEDTYFSLEQGGGLKNELARMVHALEAFYPMPGLCFIFFWQQAIWKNVVTELDPHFRRRMLEGSDNALSLEDLSEQAAQELIEARMAHYVWQPLHLEPPAGQPLFPFQTSQIQDLLKKSANKVDIFIQEARKLYRQLLTGEVDPKNEIVLTQITPRCCYAQEEKTVTITGVNIPEVAHVYFGTQESAWVECDPEQNIIAARAPRYRPGKVKIEVVAEDERTASIDFCYIDRPLNQYIDGKKLQAKRLSLKKSQTEVARKIGYRVHATISAAENNNDRYPTTDDVYEKLARYYKCSLGEFLKDDVLSDGKP